MVTYELTISNNLPRNATLNINNVFYEIFRYDQEEVGFY